MNAALCQTMEPIAYLASTSLSRCGSVFLNLIPNGGSPRARLRAAKGNLWSAIANRPHLAAFGASAGVGRAQCGPWLPRVIGYVSSVSP